MGSPAVAMSFLATTGVNCVACAVLFLSLFLVDVLRIKRKWEVRHLMLVCSVMAVLPGFVCAIVQGSLASTSRTVNLIMSITSAAFFLLAAGMSILSAARGVVKRREMEHLQTQGPGQKADLSKVFVLMYWVSGSSLCAAAGLVWSGVAYYDQLLPPSAWLYAAEAIWKSSVIVCAFAFAFTLAEGDQTAGALESVRKRYVAYLHDQDMTLHNVADGAGGDAEEVMYSGRECRRVPLYLAEDLPIWKRFKAKTFQWRDIFLFPHPVDRIYSQLHGLFTALQLICIGVLMALNLFQETSKYNPGIITVYAWMLYGYLCRVLSGALIEPQAWIVMGMVYWLRRWEWVTPSLEPDPPKRLSQGIGVVMALLQLLLFLTNQTLVCAWIAWVHWSLAGPSIVDMCTGCGVFHALASLHIIPDHICSDCQIIFLVEHQKKKKEESNTDSMSIDACFESSRVDMSALSKSAASAAVADDTGE